MLAKIVQHVGEKIPRFANICVSSGTEVRKSCKSENSETVTLQNEYLPAYIGFTTVENKRSTAAFPYCLHPQDFEIKNNVWKSLLSCLQHCCIVNQIRRRAMLPNICRKLSTDSVHRSVSDGVITQRSQNRVSRLNQSPRNVCRTPTVQLAAIPAHEVAAVVLALLHASAEAAAGAYLVGFETKIACFQ